MVTVTIHDDLPAPRPRDRGRDHGNHDSGGHSSVLGAHPPRVRDVRDPDDHGHDRVRRSGRPAARARRPAAPQPPRHRRRPSWDAVRHTLIFVSFSILIPNSLSFFSSFCARRLLHRGASSKGSRWIIFVGRRRDHSPGGRGTSSLHVGFFSILIPNTLRCSSAPQASPLGDEPRRDRVGSFAGRRRALAESQPRGARRRPPRYRSPGGSGTWA